MLHGPDCRLIASTEEINDGQLLDTLEILTVCNSLFVNSLQEFVYTEPGLKIAMVISFGRG